MKVNRKAGGVSPGFWLIPFQRIPLVISSYVYLTMRNAFQRFFVLVWLFLPGKVFAQSKTIVYDGITGIYNVTVPRDTAQVSTLIPKSPAEKAGIRLRDQIIMINDSVVAGRGLNSRAIMELLHESSGEFVDLKIKRKGEDQLMAFSLQRDPYLYQIQTYDCDYLVDSLEQWDIHDILSDSLNHLFSDVLTARYTVYSVKDGSPAAENGILPGDQVISLADEVDKDYYYHISHSILSSITTDTYFDIRRGDSILHFNQEPSLDGALKGITSQFDHDFSYSCIWIKLHTENRISENRVYLFNLPEMKGADSVNFFELSKTGEVVEKRAGSLVPVQNRDYVYKSWHAVKVPLVQGSEQTFYMRWKAENEVWGPLISLIAYDTMVLHDRTERMVLSGFFGMMGIISLFFLILFFAIRERQYLFFSCYILSLGIFLFVTEGYPGEFTLKAGGLVSNIISDYRPLLISFVSIFFLLLGVTYLELKRTYKWWYRSALIVTGLISIRIVAILLESLFKFEINGVLEDILIIGWALSVSILPLLILILPAIFRIRSGFNPAWYFLVANLVLIPLTYITIYTAEFSLTVLTLYESVLGRILHVSSVYIAAILQILIFSIGIAQKMRLDAKEKKLSQERIIEQLKENEKLKDQVNRELEQKVQERTREISEQKEEIEAQRDEIEAQRDMVFAQKQEMTDSIVYAQRIQAAVMPQKEYMDRVIPEYFVFFKPRDIVSGDFYWIKEIRKSLVVVAADCTGHGVPGAFMSMLGITLLNEQLGKSRIDKPSVILGNLREKVKEMLVQLGNINDQKDGMDMAIMVLDKEKRELQFAGANNPLFLIRSGPSMKGIEITTDSVELNNVRLHEIKGDKQPIGVYWEETDFTNQSIKLQENDTLYIFSDGFVDQYGGKYRKKFKTPRFKELLLSMQEESMADQKKILDNAFESWRGENEQIDDVCVIGLRV